MDSARPSGQAAAKYWRRWTNPHLIVCVFNNEDLNQVTWEQRVMEGNPRFEATQQIPNVPYHQFGEQIGLKGTYCDQADGVGAAWDAAGGGLPGRARI